MLPLNPIPREHREDFQTYKLDISMGLLRTVSLLFCVMYALLGLAGMLRYGFQEPTFILICFAVVIPLFLLTIRLMDYMPFERIWQYLFLLNFILAGAGISHMLVRQPARISYYGGMFIVIFYGYLLFRLNFAFALLGGILNLALFVITFFLYHGGMETNILFMTIFFAAANVIGAIGNYQYEGSLFREYLSTQEVRKNNQLLKMNLMNSERHLQEEKIGTIYALAKMVEAQDYETGAHIERIGLYSQIITLGLEESYCNRHGYKKYDLAENIRISSTLHDIGKVAISATILNKPGRLNEDERRVVQEHTKIGARIIRNVLENYPDNELMRDGYDIALYHHERWDGSGYPKGLMKEEIPLVARIVAIADVYDALISKRPYKEAYTHDYALKIIMEDAGSHFDPYLARVFRQQSKTILEAFNQVERKTS